MRTGLSRFRTRLPGQIRSSVKHERYILVACQGQPRASYSSLHAIDSTSGEELWRYVGNFDSSISPVITLNRVIVAAESGGAGSISEIDLQTGALITTKTLPAPPDNKVNMHLAVTQNHVLVTLDNTRKMDTTASRPCAVQASETLYGHNIANASDWAIPHPMPGAAQHVVDEALIFNDGDKAVAVDASNGEYLWQRKLAHPQRAEQCYAAPRRLESILRAGALFIPGHDLHIVNPCSGRGVALNLDLVPDVFRVSSRGDIFVADEEGRVSKYEPLPQLRLLK